MKKSFKIIIIIVSILLLLLGIAYWLFVKSVGDVEVPSTLNEDIVEFPELNEKVYIRARAWGLAGNHEEIIISTTPIEKDRQAVKGEDYIFYTTEIYYQKKGTDTLMVYADASTIGKIPNGLRTTINIVPVGLKNYGEVKQYKQNYKEYDLNKISVYNE
jgi:hypothetical protein